MLTLNCVVCSAQVARQQQPAVPLRHRLRAPRRLPRPLRPQILERALRGAAPRLEPEPLQPLVRAANNEVGLRQAVPGTYQGGRLRFDKFQVVSDPSGTLGVNFEHSYADGLAWNRWLSEVWYDMQVCLALVACTNVDRALPLELWSS
eukprot:1911181-Rhodomonas_salina.1